MEVDEFEYGCRGKLLEEQVSRLVQSLLQLERDTQPSKGPASEKDKDVKSRLALSLVDILVGLLAGWAICHQAGHVIDGADPGIVPPSGHKDDPIYSEAARQANKHVHEATGWAYLEERDDLPNYRPRSIETDRDILAKLLANSTSAVGGRLRRMAAEGFLALKFGEVTPLMEPSITGKWGDEPYQLSNLKLLAIEHVAFLCATGEKKGAAQEKVAGAYGRGVRAIMDWESELRRERGPVYVYDSLCRAKVAGEQYRGLRFIDKEQADNICEYWGDKVLAENGEKFRNFKPKKP